MPSTRKDIGSGWVRCHDNVTWINLDLVSRIVRTEPSAGEFDLHALIVGAESSAVSARQIPIRLTATEDEMDELLIAIRGSMNLVDVPSILDGGTDGGAPKEGSGLTHGWVLCEDDSFMLNLDNVTRLVLANDESDYDLTAYIVGDEDATQDAATVAIFANKTLEQATPVIDAIEDTMQLVKVVEVVDTEE
jgi:hypothetical protein